MAGRGPDRSGRHPRQRGDAARLHHRRGDGGGEGRRVRPRHAAVRPGRAGRRRDLARASRPSTRRWSCGATASPRRCWPGCTRRACRCTRAWRPTSTSTRGASTQLGELVAAARRAQRPARVHLKLDTGLARGGATAAEWPALLEAAAKAQADGEVEVVGVWSHFAYADAPGHETIDRQLAAFADGLARRRAVRHHPAIPAHRQLGGHADPPRRALRPGPPGHRDLRPVPDRGRDVRPASGDDRPRPGRPDQAGARPVRASRTGTPITPSGRRRWP